jgi:3-oxoacyl-[acyl-carrier-protein] synthase I
MPTANKGIPIIGTGARTPLGLNAPATAAAVRAGVTMMQEHPFMIDKQGERMLVSPDAELSIALTGIDRLLQLALEPSLEALSPILNANLPTPPISVSVALPEVRPGAPENLELGFGECFRSHLSEYIEIHHFSCHSLGHAGGLACIENALSLIGSGKTQLCLVGGVESYLYPETLEWLDETEQLHSKSTIWGFCPGEGAGFCLLVSQEVANQLGLSSSVQLLSAASASEINRIKTETVCIGEGLSEAFKKTLADLPIDARVDHTICDMNGEPYRGDEYGFAMLRSKVKFSDESDFETPADCWGDVGAASGPLFTILAAFAAEKGYAPGPFTFLWASSECGLRAAALLRATAPNRRS